MSRATIQAAIIGLIEDINGIGAVYSFERWAANWDHVLNLFKDGDVFRGGWIRRVSTAIARNKYSEAQAAHVFKICWFHSLNDSNQTEVTAQAMADTIATALLADETINNTCSTYNATFGAMAGLSGPQLDLFENRMIGGVLCHYFEIKISAIENLS